MKTAELLSDLYSLDVKLWLNEERLRYSAPAGVLTPALLAELAEHKPEICDLLRKAQKAVVATNAAVLPLPRNGNLPLSFSQQRLWFLDQLAPDNAAYHVPSAIRLSGQLNLAALKQAFNEIIRRHEVLRTTFATFEGQPSQVVGIAFDAPLPMIDLQRLDRTTQETYTQKLAGQDAIAPFDLSHGPLLRTSLLRLNEQEHVLLVVMHHIISDGWSLGVLIRELAALYEAFSQGRSSPLPELAIQYADFARWQREWLSGVRLEEQVKYWKQQLADAPILALPIDKSRPSVQTFQGAMSTLFLPESLAAPLQELSRQTGTTLFMTMLAGFHALLHRYAQEATILTGTPVANRTRAETEPLIGFFVNTLVLRSDFADDPTFLTHLERLRQHAVTAYAHQDLPFELLVEELLLPRDLSYNPLFQVMFSWGEAEWSELALAGLEVSAVALENQTSQFDLTLTVGEVAGGRLRCVMQYNTALFEASSIRQMLGHYEELLRSVVREPQQRVSQLALLSTGERQQLREWNETVAYETVATLGELFERQVERDVQAVGVVSGERKVTYGELNERANRVARYLRELGVGAETRVGLLLERGIEMVVGLLGTIKAGAAYVPLDASYPQARLEYMLADAGVSVVLTERRLQRLAGEVAASVGTVLSLDEPWAKVESAANLAATVDSENLAYIIYTSGSTGNPKGVMVTHRNVLRLFAATQDSFAFGARDVWTLFHSYAFDFSVWEMWGALLYGGRLVIVPYWTSRSPEGFYELLCRERVTVLNQTPFAFRQLSQIDERSARDVQQGLALRLVIFGGEALSFESLGQWFRDHGDEKPELVNMYGITETTVHVTKRRVRGDDLAANTGSLIGRPIADLCGYVLDQHMELLPTGVPGELYVGGPGVARGYLGRPELTAERFVPDPFTNKQGARLYRTGDLVRYRAQGELEYLSRVDQQVKLRGLRIELGEIQTALEQHAEVREAVVICKEEVAGVPRLIAYIVPAPIYGEHDLVNDLLEGRLTRKLVPKLRSFLQERLPDYMVPSAFALLEDLPRLPNGKLDRASLPSPDRVVVRSHGVYTPPRTAIEETLTEIWKQVLRLEHIGIHDSFFELGGDSILSIQIVARANQAGLKLSPKLIFRHRTIAELSQVAAPSAASTSARQGLVTGEIPLTPIQRAFFEQHVAEQHHFNQSVLLELKRPLKAQQLQRVIEQLVLHHDALRLRFKRNDLSGEWEQVYAGAETAHQVRVEEIDLSGIVANEVEAVLETRATELQSGLNFEDGPLMKVALSQGPESSGQRILVVLHHLAVDAVSWQILLDDLQRGIEQDQRGEEVSWGPKTTSYGQWSERLTEYAKRPEVREELAFWSEVVREAAELPLLLDYEGPERTLSSSRSIVQHLESDATRALLQEVPAAYHTEINDALLTALVEAIGRWSGEGRVVVEMEGHGREEISDDMDLSRTVGWFTSLYPVVLDVAGAATPGAALQQVKTQLRRIPGRGIGYGVLRYLSNEGEIREQLQGAGPVDLSFNYLGQLDQVLDKDSLFAGASEPTGPQRSERGRQRYALEVTVAVVQGKLRVCFTYNEQLHAAETIQGVSNGYMEALRELLEHCQSPEAGGFTPSDFPLIDLNQAELDAALSEIE